MSCWSNTLARPSTKPLISSSLLQSESEVSATAALSHNIDNDRHAYPDLASPTYEVAAAAALF